MTWLGKKTWKGLKIIAGSRDESRTVGVDTQTVGTNQHLEHRIACASGGEGGNSKAHGEPACGSEPLSRDVSLNVSVGRVARTLLWAAVGLTLMSLAAGIAELSGLPFVRLFYVGRDLSLASWYSALVLVLASILLLTIAIAIRASEYPRYVRRWAILAAIFAYLSCDEMLRLHERMADTVLRPALDSLGFIPTGVLSYPWVIVYAPLVALFVLAYFGFWRTLPVRIRKLFLIAGAMFVGGALGVELFNAYHDQAGGSEPLVIVGTHIEEMLEMGGIIVFVYALMAYLAAYLRVGQLRLCANDP